MGKSPHSGGESRFFPDAFSGIPGEGPERRRHGPEMQRGKRERSRGRGAFFKLGRTFENQGQVSRGHRTCAAPSSSGNARDGQAEGSRPSCSRQQGRNSGREKSAGTEGQAARQASDLRPAVACRRGFTGRRTEESPRRAGAFRSEGGQRQDMTDTAVWWSRQEGGSPASDAILRRPVPS